MTEKYSGEIDPEIAELLNFTSPPSKESGAKAAPNGSPSAPSFDDLFTAKPNKAPSRDPGADVDLSVKTFSPIQEYWGAPQPYFENKDYYKIILKDGGETAARVHKILTELMNAPDPEARGQARLRLVPAWWDFLGTVVRDLSPKMEQPKALALRFGALLPSLLSPEQRQMVSCIKWDNRTGEPIHYLDEWLRKVGSGEVVPLATDEEFKPVKKSQDNGAALQRVEKLQGQVQAQSGLIQLKLQELSDLENSLPSQAELLRQHERNPRFPHLADVYNSAQKSSLTTIQEAIKRLAVLDRELAASFGDLEKFQNELDQARQRLDDSGGNVVDAKTALHELGSLRQMAKLSCGRQGNHFPLMMKQYLPPRQEDVGTRENVLAIMAEVEHLDPGVFQRTFKGMATRIVPHVILLPSYGEYGLCWEPFEKFNRSTSRGRIAIPMYPKNLKQAVIFALGDLRWQVAKEKAGYRWMEEGITGWYYQWFTDRGLRGDVREFFIQDYILWITKESEGTQKLDKDIRGIFWRNIPFPDDVRDTLKNRGFVYSELYKKDINRSLSDGY